ncbi:MAG: biotin--[acetyl-CoA-carboxylase] ligase [Pseudomonadota bacterium]
MKLASGTSLQVFETLDSTSLEAKRRAQLGAAGPLWILAITQTAAYGRRGRAWTQQAGDFAGTLLFSPKAPVERLGQVSFIVAVALAATFEELIDPGKIKLKWPNDVLIDGGKSAGILLENLGRQLSIGIGINVVTAPDNMPYPAARLCDHLAAAPSPKDLVHRLDHYFWALYEQWCENGFSPIRAAWLDRARGLGEEITVRLPRDELHGVFDGLDETGALILRMGAGTRTIAAGEVFFGASDESTG